MGGSSSKQPRGIRRSKTSADLLRKLGGNIDDAPLDDDLEAEVEPQEPKKTVHPQAEPLNLDLTTTVMLHVRCEMLPEAKPSFIVLYSRWANDPEWVEIGMTELNSNGTVDPQFKKEFELEFRLEMSRQLRFEVYHAREHQPREYLDEHKFLGTVEVSLSDIFVCRANPAKDHGWYKSVLDNPLRFADKDNYAGGSPGILCAYAEEEVRNKWLVSWEMKASGISSRDRWKNFGRGSPDAYCVIRRCRYQALPSDEGSEDKLVPQLVQQAVYRTEVCRKSKNPAWQRVSLTPSSLCHMDAKQEVIIEVFDWYRLTEAEYIGEAAVSYETLSKHFGDGKQLELSLFEVEGKREGRGILKRLRALSKSRTSSRSKSNTSSKRSTKRSRSPGHTRSPGRSPSPSPTTSKDVARTRQSRGRGATNSKGASEISPAQSPPAWAGGSSRAITQSPMRSPLNSMSPATSKEMAVRSSRVDALQSQKKSVSKLSGVSQKSQRSQRSQRSIRSGSDSDSPKPSPDSSQQLARFESGKLRRATTHSGGSGEASNTSKTFTNRRKATNTSRAESLGPSISQRSLGQNSAGSRASKAKKGKLVGKLAIVNPAQLRRYSFLDYVRSGLQLRLAMAVDFTRSNSKNEDSCHGSAGEIVNTTPYATAIRAIGKALSSYDSDDKILAYGFGAKIPPSHTLCSDCFALTGDYFEPEIDGIDQVLTAYQRALRIVHLHGPTRLAPIIDLINTFAEQFHNPLEILRIDMVYHVLTIITDGQVSDELETINALVRSANLPVTVVIIAMGDEEHTYLQDLSQEVTRIRRLKAPLGKQHVAEQRQVVHYVPYHLYEDCPEELAAAALADIPREVVGYYKDLDIKPHRLELFEDYKGENVNMWLPAEVTEEAKSKSRSRASTRMSTRAQTRAGSMMPSKDKGGSKSMLDTSTSGFSVASGLTSYLGLPEGKEEPQKKKRKPPPMLFPLKDALVIKGMQLGYAKHAVLRAVNEGLPSGTIDFLVDNVMYAGTGRSPPYRAAAKQALPDTRPATSLPGQVDDRSVSRTNSRIASPSQPRMGTELSKRDRLLHKGSRGSSDLSASGSWEGEELPTGTRRTSRQSQQSQESKPDSTDAGGRPRGITKDAELAAQALLGKDGGGSRVTTKSGRFEGDELEAPTVTLTRAATSSKELVPKGILSRQGSKLFDGKFYSTSKSVGFHTEVLAPPSPVAEQPEQPPGFIERTETRLGTFGMNLPANACSICLERPVEMQLNPCGHKLTCAICAPNLGSTCPLCQSSIKEVRPMDDA